MASPLYHQVRMNNFTARQEKHINKELASSLELELVEPMHAPLKVAFSLYESLNTPRSLCCYLLAKAGQFHDLAALTVDPLHYLTHEADKFFYDRQATDFLRKAPGFSTPEYLEQRTLNKVLECEEANAVTNYLFRSFSGGRFSFTRDVDSILHTAMRKIAKVLGKFNPERVVDSCKFGPGKSMDIPRTHDYGKLQASPSVTEEFAELSLGLLAEFEPWCDALTNTTGDGEFTLIITPGGTFSQVPKDSNINRPIEIQPLLNVFFQLGIGSELRRILQREGVDLDSQTRNQHLAEYGSVFADELATMDLSSASDLISYELVKFLLSGSDPAWFHALSVSRTSTLEFENKEHHVLERFSAMGNGYTFELESLIFWALTTSTCDYLRIPTYDVSVYGDDIIVPCRAFDLLGKVLNSVGCKVNQRKSFKTGHFRESCGTDWFNGVAVRPYFQKKDLNNVSDVISLANGLARAAQRRSGFTHFDRKFARAWSVALRFIPIALRRRIACGYTATDDIVYKSYFRAGYRVFFKPNTSEFSSWYAARATVLYRAFRRDPNRVIGHQHANNNIDASVNSLEYVDRCASVKAQASRSALVTQRGAGSWCLRREGWIQLPPALMKVWA